MIIQYLIKIFNINWILFYCEVTQMANIIKFEMNSQDIYLIDSANVHAIFQDKLFFSHLTLAKIMLIMISGVSNIVESFKIACTVLIQNYILTKHFILINPTEICLVLRYSSQ